MRSLGIVVTVACLVGCTEPTQGSVEQGEGAKPVDAEETPATPGSATPTVTADQPCTLQNTMGVWGLVHIEAAEPGVEDFYRTAPYEYVHIRPGGAYAYFATDAALADIGQVNGRLDQADAADGVSDVADFREPGVMVVLRNGQPFQAFRCVIAGGAQGRALAGDMVWSEYQGMPRLYRVQRRLQ